MENKYEKIMEEEFIKDTNGFKSTSELCLFFVKHTEFNFVQWLPLFFMREVPRTNKHLGMQEFLFTLQDTNDF